MSMCSVLRSSLLVNLLQQVCSSNVSSLCLNIFFFLGLLSLSSSPRSFFRLVSPLSLSPAYPPPSPQNVSRLTCSVTGRQQALLRSTPPGISENIFFSWSG
ncbi:hypothetical protein B0T10DRAFT_293769 [Thelonectria olida]|uniref:Secreted protein n=1 Tax=Thelonectria olida TaxID=1576542 RepID=A0A9P8W7B6_9HYPO|nr:hypothetical protein B0T10DRAFT_293769 [Thelonectria olida]